MPLTFYYASGSPYAWRVWLALEHKRIPYDFKLLSFDAGDLEKPDFAALNPRRRVPAIADDGFALYESAAIVEYLEDKRPGEPRLFAADLRRRAVERRMVRETDQYVAPAMEALAQLILFTKAEHQSEERIAAAAAKLKAELARWEPAGDHLAGTLSAADFALYPLLALAPRIAKRKPGLDRDLVGPKLGAWMQRMEALPVTQKTWPPHWR